MGCNCRVSEAHLTRRARPRVSRSRSALLRAAPALLPASLPQLPLPFAPARLVAENRS